MGKIDTVDEMILMLKHNPGVVGLIEYGSDHHADHYATGDCDLFVVIGQKHPTVESLHLFVGGVPVDLNLITLDRIRSLNVSDGFHLVALLDGRILHDTTGEVTLALQGLQRRRHQSVPPKLSEHAVAFTRHGHRHVFDKIKDRLHTMPVFCRFLLSTSIYWLVETYFAVRGIVFKGEKHAIEYLRRHEPELYSAVGRFYATNDMEEQV